MAIKKYLTWAIAAFVIFYLLRSPENAAEIVQRAAGGLAEIANRLSRFVNGLL
jgi:hypothetical protein